MEFKKSHHMQQHHAVASVPVLNTPTEAAAPKKSPQRTPIPRGVKRFIIATFLCALIIGVVGMLYELNSDRFTNEPTFQTVLPSGTSIGALGGWTRVSPPDKPPAFAYSDTVDGVAIRITEQQMPNGQSVADIAKNYNATGKISINNSTIYIGNSFKGPQSVIFSKNDLLILIGSESKINNNSWARYINQLQ